MTICGSPGAMAGLVTGAWEAADDEPAAVAPAPRLMFSISGMHPKASVCCAAAMPAAQSGRGE